MDTFRVRLNCVDHYQASPAQFDPKVPISTDSEKEDVKVKVPVIRVFGATEKGQKVCAHIHGALPYLYIKYHGSLTPDDVTVYIHQLQISIDHALTMSYRRSTFNDKPSFVAHITLLKGIPFYGFHVGYGFFLKIYMLNPMNMTRLADLLRQGAILRKPIQPYESHMQYLAQWMCDYNLYGCAYIECSRVKFRSPIPEYLELSDENHNWHDRTIDISNVLDETQHPKQSHCSIEVDICVADILNRKDVQSRPIHHDFVEFNHPLSHSEKLVQSMAGLWRDETKRRKLRIGLEDQSSSPFPAEVLVSVSADPRNTQAGGWIHEEEFRERTRDVIKEEKAKSDGTKIDFPNFVGRTSFEQGVQTALDSVEDLFEPNLDRVREMRRQTQRTRNMTNLPALNIPQVDEGRLFSILAEDTQCDSDEEPILRPGSPKPSAEHSDKDVLGNPVTTEASVAGIHVEPQPTVRAQQVGAQSSPRPDKLMLETAADLEVFGIHSSCGPLLQDGIFELDEDFMGDISDDRKAHTGKANGRSSKRRKFAHQQTADQQEVLIPRQEDHSKEGSLQRLSASDETTTKTVDGVPPVSLLDGQAVETHQPESETNAAVLQRQSQGLSPGGKITFPVVKITHDPATIQKSNQRVRAQWNGTRSSKDDSLPTTNSDQATTSHGGAASSRTLSPSANAKLGIQASSTCAQIQSVFELRETNPLLFYARGPISALEVQLDMKNSCHPTVLYQDAFYSREMDVPERTREYAGKEFRLESNSIAFLPLFDPTGTSPASLGQKSAAIIDKTIQDSAFSHRRLACSLRNWEIRDPPPSWSEVKDWVAGQATDDAGYSRSKWTASESLIKADVSQIDYSTQKNKHGFKYSQKQRSTSVKHETQYMSIMSLEIHVDTRNSFVPDPQHDAVCSIFWCLRANAGEQHTSEGNFLMGVIVLSEDGHLANRINQQVSIEVEEESSELDLINRMVDIVRRWDPDIITGYEVHGSSWGYLIERARSKYDFNLCDEFSRVKSDSHGRFGKEDDRWGFNHTSTIRVTGRHMINIWRAMRGELNLSQYTMENVVFQICHRRIPHYSHSALTQWYRSRKAQDLAKVLEYYISRVQLDLEILEENELVPRTSEQARLLGVDFFSVFSRGSQFKVESLMFRIAKPENLLLPSPSRKQVGQQNALECLPLVMEPQSSFYTSPLLVLDFQSLYPSVMIAYNYCYSTCLGRVVNWRGQNKMGYTDYHRQPRLLELLQDHINIAPNGIMYARPEIRKSLLAKMLSEILETRVMVKSGMKVDRDDKTLQRLLNNRQLALKLIANVTYGYTSASFSGRMPCSEIADSIVQTGRETLEKAIALIHSVARWRAEVVYGDTDSLFVYLKGRTKDEAFDIGQDIAKTITDMNPRPVKLKFEKVYFPCVLLAKKRYVGFKYESKDQMQPQFDAKGIETIRRDGTPAGQKIEERALRILFRSADLSQIKQYFQNQCEKIMRGRVSIQDFCFAKEVKLGTYSDKGPPPPGALISTRKMLEDPRAEPQYGERVPYVVVAGGPGARLIDRCVPPESLLHDVNAELDSEYYISKHLIPPLERIFNLVGANVRQWYDEMPKVQRIRRVDISSVVQGKEHSAGKKTLEAYMKSSSCLVCQAKLEDGTGLCKSCIDNAGKSLFLVQSRLSKEEAKTAKLEHICLSCSNLAWGEEVKCDSKDCPVFYTRTRQDARLRNAAALSLTVQQNLDVPMSSSGLDW